MASSKLLKRVALYGVPFVAVSVGLTAVSEYSPYGMVTACGGSMQPTLNPNSSDTDILLVRRLSCDSNNYSELLRRGDVVNAVNPRTTHADEMIVKRIVGLPGDTLITPHYRKDIVTLKPGKCWLEGDNPEKTRDSNYYGPVPLHNIRSKAVAILWPPSRMGGLAERPAGGPHASRMSKVLYHDPLVLMGKRKKKKSQQPGKQDGEA